jgi:hypothetical protein
MNYKIPVEQYEDDDIGGMEITERMEIVLGCLFALTFMVIGAALLALIQWIV